MTVAPVVVTVEVKAPPARAFDIFTRQIGRWWPSGRTPAPNPHADIVIEPYPGGRWFERDADGGETPWGRVLAFEPPERLLLAWQLDSQFKFDPDFETEVELTFEPTEVGGSRVILEHRNLERFGADAEKIAGQVGAGWPRIIGIFAEFAETG
jgi:uncharacterized protein YndB with AHSA1/START domain